jgi:hypothetical protein
MTLGHAIAVILLAHIGTRLNLDRFNFIAKLYLSKYLKGETYKIDNLEKVRDVIFVDEL